MSKKGWRTKYYRIKVFYIVKSAVCLQFSLDVYMMMTYQGKGYEINIVRRTSFINA